MKLLQGYIAQNGETTDGLIHMKLKLNISNSEKVVIAKGKYRDWEE